MPGLMADWRRVRHGPAVLAVVLAVFGCAAPSPPARGPAAGQGAAPAPAALGTATPSAAPIKVTVNYAARGNSHAGAWLAYEGGYFREQGLNVDLTYIPSTATVLQSMVAGEVQISGIDAGSAIQATVGGVDVVLLIAGNNRPVHSIYAQPRIADAAALRGGTLGITRAGSATASAARLALGLWGMAPDRDLAFRQLGQTNAIFVALQTDQVDAGVLSSPATLAARQAGYRELIDLNRDGPEFPSIVVGALRPWVTANEETVRRVSRAYVQAMARFHSDKPWALDVYRKYLEVDDPVLLEDAYAVFERCCPAIPYVGEEGLDRLIADLALDEPRLAGRKANEFVDARFLREIEAAGTAAPR